MSEEPDEPERLPIVDAVTSSSASAFVAFIALVHPGLAVVTGPALAALPSWTPVMTAIWRRRRRNVDLAAESGAEAGGVTVDDLTAASVDDPFKEQLGAAVIEAAARSVYDPKIKALGRAWAAGVFTDDEGRLAQEIQFVRTMEGLELPHIRVLAVYGSEMKWGPETETERGTRTKTLLTDSVVLPEYGEMLEQLRSMLVSEGLLKVHDPGGMTFVQPTVLVITPAGREVLQRLREAAESD